MEGQSSNAITFSQNGVQSLSQVMSMYPRQWNASSRRILLMDVAVLGKESSAADLAFRIHRLKENLLLPLATIILNEREAVETDKEKLQQQLRSSLESLQEEKRKLQDQLVQQSMFIETLFEEIVTSSNQHKSVTEQLQCIILGKDLEIQKLLTDRELQSLSTTRISDIDSQVESLKDSMKDNCMEWVSSASDGYASLERSASVSSNNGSTVTSLLSLPDDDAQKQHERYTLAPKTGLLQVVISGAWQEGLSSFKVVEERGIFSVPSAVLRFWFAMACRVAEYLVSFIFLRMKQGYCSQL